MLKTKELEFNYENQIFFKFQNIDLKSNENLLIIQAGMHACSSASSSAAQGIDHDPTTGISLCIVPFENNFWATLFVSLEHLFHVHCIAFGECEYTSFRPHDGQNIPTWHHPNDPRKNLWRNSTHYLRPMRAAIPKNQRHAPLCHR